MFKALWAVGTAAVVAAAITFFPSLSPVVEASTPAAASESATVGQSTADAGAATCERAWPYYSADCLRGQGGRAPARIVTTDRVVPR